MIAHHFSVLYRCQNPNPDKRQPPSPYAISVIPGFNILNLLYLFPDTQTRKHAAYRIATQYPPIGRFSDGSAAPKHTAINLRRKAGDALCAGIENGTLDH